MERLQLSNPKTPEVEGIPGDKTAIQRRISATDSEIDNLVYELYGLTDEEIKIVEGGSR